jgi:hypothetical protein
MSGSTSAIGELDTWQRLMTPLEPGGWSKKTELVKNSAFGQRALSVGRLAAVASVAELGSTRPNAIGQGRLLHIQRQEVLSFEESVRTASLTDRDGTAVSVVTPRS